MDVRYVGFPGKMLGGYLGGLATAPLGYDGTVTLRRPVLLTDTLDRDGATLLVDGQVAATATGDVPEIEPPALPSEDELAAAIAAFPVVRPHPVPGCFVCGLGHEGLHLHPGALPDGRAVAGTWTPTEDPAPETVWASLDCPGIWGSALDPLPGATHLVTGRLGVRLVRPIRAGERCVVLGWPIGGEGRCMRVGAATYVDGELVALCEQTMIATDWGFPLPTRPNATSRTAT